MTCPECGVNVIAGAEFCHKCGANIPNPTAASTDAPSTDASAPQAADASDAVDRFRASAAAKQADDDDGDAEQELWEGRFSPKAMIGTWVGLGALTLVVLIWSAIAWSGTTWLVLFAVFAVVWLVLLGVYFYRRFSVRYRLTNQRFVHQAGLLSRRTDRVEVIDMDDITFIQGPIERLVGVGRIKVTSSDRTHPEITLPGIDDVERVATLMDDARRRERRRRGLHIEAV